MCCVAAPVTQQDDAMHAMVARVAAVAVHHRWLLPAAAVALHRRAKICNDGGVH
jgi:hypothetical protein